MLKISNTEFSLLEELVLKTRAHKNLLQDDVRYRDMSVADRKDYLAKLTPQNILRAALGPADFPLRQRGGARKGTGNRTVKGSRAVTTGGGIPG